jgi:branched-chain amino acid transport system ATP-binding protein
VDEQSAVLEVEDVCVAFSGVQALKDVSFSASPGEVLGLIGPNGAGKTTLFDVISGVRRPDSGRVVLAGEDVTRRGAVHRSRSGMRRTFQRQQVFSTLTAEENLLCAVEWRGGGGGIVADMVRFPRRRRVESGRRGDLRALLSGCGLSEVAGRPAGELPTGGARMVELGRAMAGRPTVILLDEPTSGLGASDLSRLSEQVRRLRDSGECAVLLIEHDIAFVTEHCDRIIAMERGTVLAEGSVEEIRSNQAVQDAYLG